MNVIMYNLVCLLIILQQKYQFSAIIVIFWVAFKDRCLEMLVKILCLLCCSGNKDSICLKHVFFCPSVCCHIIVWREITILSAFSEAMYCSIIQLKIIYSTYNIKSLLAQNSGNKAEESVDQMRSMSLVPALDEMRSRPSS